MSQEASNQSQETNLLRRTSSEEEVSGYRLARKSFMCHVCDREFKKMVPVTELVEVECPQCNQTFTEEISTVSQNHSSTDSSSSLRRISGPASPAISVSQPPAQPEPMAAQQVDPMEELMSQLLGFGRLFTQRNQPQAQQTQQLAQQPQNGIRRRRIIIDPFGNQTIIEEITTNGGSMIQRTSQQQQSQPRSLIITADPFSSALFGNLNLNFRSFAPDESILAHIMRLSEQERGRTGTPPASEESIKNLPEVQVQDSDCKNIDKEKEYPRCSICCEDLTEKATRMPCGHLFNQDCISEWLKQHNQCPVCRYEMPTDDNEYERTKAASSNQ